MNRAVLIGGSAIALLAAGLIAWKFLGTNSARGGKPASQTAAQTDKSAPNAIAGVTQIKLNAPLIEKFISSYPEVKAFGDKYQVQLNSDTPGADSNRNIISSMEQALAAHGVLGEFKSTIGKYGFASAEEYFQTAYSTFIAYAYSNPEMSPAHLKEQMEKSIAQIDANPNMPAEQKNQFKSQIAQSLAQFQKSAPPAENISAVKPYLEKLKTMIDESRANAQ